MGTRHLTMVISGGKTRIAQYGQWDGYFSGQGRTILNFLRLNYFKDKLAGFKEKLEKCKFIDEAKQKEIDDFYASIGVNDGWMNMEQAEKFHEAYPLLTRDNGAKVLEMIDESDEAEYWLQDSTSFAGDGLFCEYAYVVDFDKNTFEVYVGFSKKPLAKTQRFKYLEESMTADEKYYPVKMVKKYSLDELPMIDEFLAWGEEFDRKEEEKYQKEEKKKKAKA